jgi:hypothetical protein
VSGPVWVATDPAELAARLAAELGDGWSWVRGTPGGNGDGAEIRGPQGSRFALAILNGRLYVKGRQPIGCLGPTVLDPHRAYITMTLAKTPRQLAADIRRRLLPEYLDAVPLAQERAAAWREGQVAAERLRAHARRELSRVGGLWESRAGDLHPGRIGCLSPDGPSVTLDRVDAHQGDPKITVSCPREIAPALLTAIADVLERHARWR